MMLISPVARLFAARHHVGSSIFSCVADSLACGCLLALCGDRLRLKSWYTRLIASLYFVPVAVLLIFLSSRLIGVGVLSYSFYLWQQFFLNRNESSAICQFPPNIVLAMLATLASYLPCRAAAKWMSQEPSPRGIDPCGKAIIAKAFVLLLTAGSSL